MKVGILEKKDPVNFLSNKVYRYTLTKVSTYTRVHKMTWIQRSQISELESLGLKPTKINELNDNYEMTSLIDNIKQNMISDYKSMPIKTAP